VESCRETVQLDALISSNAMRSRLIINYTATVCGGFESAQRHCILRQYRHAQFMANWLKNPACLHYLTGANTPEQREIDKKLQSGKIKLSAPATV